MGVISSGFIWDACDKPLFPLMKHGVEALVAPFRVDLWHKAVVQ